MAEFEWTDEGTVLGEQLAVAIYVNPRGDTVIRQEADQHGEDDAIVIIGRHNLATFVKALQKHLSEQECSDQQQG